MMTIIEATMYKASETSGFFHTGCCKKRCMPSSPVMNCPTRSSSLRRIADAIYASIVSLQPRRMKQIEDFRRSIHVVFGFADGTFKVVPTIFFQLWTIHAMYESHTVPLMYALLTNKTQVSGGVPNPCSGKFPM